MSILDDLDARYSWSARDPGNLCIPLKAAAKQPECHCGPDRQDPRLDLSDRHVRCFTCLRVIPASCKRRQVTWLRSLLKLPPDQLDLDSITDLLL